MIRSLAYVGVNSPNYKEWEDFGPNFLGAQLTTPGPDGSVRLKVDDASWRIQIHPGEKDETAYFGWAVDFEADLDALIVKLADLGVRAEFGSDELAKERDVNKLITFTDPWGFKHEVVFALGFKVHSFRPGRNISGFVTGDQGLGHVLIFAPDIDKAAEFYTAAFGFELSDKIIFDNFKAYFYHVNQRHHTFAIGQGPEGVGVFNHLMLQVKTMNDVGTGWDLVEEKDIPLVLSLGRHSNDQMFSFYVTTPSGFNIEYGFDGLEITEGWVPRLYHQNQIWGHKFQEAARTRGPGIVHQIGG